jgi:hypothetical protein
MADNPPFKDIQIFIYPATEHGGYDPDVGEAIGSSEVVGIQSIPQTQGWFTFNFPTPVEVFGDEFYGIYIKVLVPSGFSPVDIYRVTTTDSSDWWYTQTQAAGGGTWNATSDMAIKVRLDGADDYISDTLSSSHYDMNGSSKGLRVQLNAGEEEGPSVPTLDYPTDLLTNVYLNSDGLLEIRWSDDDDEDIAFYTVYFGFKDGELVPQDDRSRYSIVTLKMSLGEQLEYDTDYQWGVLKVVDEVETYSELFEFKTVGFVPPGPKGTPVNGLNGIVTIKRLVAAANNKIWYET